MKILPCKKFLMTLSKHFLLGTLSSLRTKLLYQLCVAVYSNSYCMSSSPLLPVDSAASCWYAAWFLDQAAWCSTLYSLALASSPVQLNCIYPDLYRITLEWCGKQCLQRRMKRLTSLCPLMPWQTFCSGVPVDPTVPQVFRSDISRGHSKFQQ